MQFIVISLKTGLFQGSESLVGVYRDQDANSSNTLTLDVSFLFFQDAKQCTDPGIVTKVSVIYHMMEGWILFHGVDGCIALLHYVLY